MANLSKAEIIRRLGMAPELWEFRGQCYDTGEGNGMLCALTQTMTRFCFTLKPRQGKGKAIIGPASFFLLKRHNPELFMQLERGRLWLQLNVDASASDVTKHALIKRLSENRRRLRKLESESKSKIKTFRAANRKSELPEILAQLDILLNKRQPQEMTDEVAALWYEDHIIAYENLLLQLPIMVRPVRRRVEEHLPDVAHAAMASNFAPIPTIDF